MATDPYQREREVSSNIRVDRNFTELDGKVNRNFKELDGKIDRNFKELDGKIDRTAKYLGDKIDQMMAEMRANMRKWQYWALGAGVVEVAVIIVKMFVS